MQKTVLVLVAVVNLLLIYSCDQKPPRPQGPAGEAVYVYQFENKAVADSAESKRMVQRFLGERNIGDLYKSDENSVYYVSDEDVNETFQQDLNNGNFTFNRSMKKYEGDYAPQLPGQEEAVRIAEEFLNKNSLSPGNRAELKVAHIGGLRASTVIDGSKAGPVIDKLVTVTYSRTVDNLPVIGPGSKIVVNLGEKGEVMGLIRRWRELNAGSRKQVRPEEMISQHDAEERAERQIKSEFGERTSFRILNSGKAYFDNNGSILQPVYMFEASINLQSNDKNTQPVNYLCVIPMLKSSPEPLNLTATDPRAKRLIKSVRQGETVPDQNGYKRVVD